MMMKADVLSGINKIKACIGYTNNDGKKIDYLPFENSDNLKPIYKEIEGWKEDLTNLNDLDNAPQALHNYINWLEKTLETPITIVSVGPNRTQTLHK